MSRESFSFDCKQTYKYKNVFIRYVICNIMKYVRLWLTFKKVKNTTLEI